MSQNDVGKENHEKIHRPTYENVYWRIKMNQQIYKFQCPGIGTVMKVRGGGDAVRMDGEMRVKTDSHIACRAHAVLLRV